MILDVWRRLAFILSSFTGVIILFFSTSSLPPDLSLSLEIIVIL